MVVELRKLINEETGKTIICHNNHQVFSLQDSTLKNTYITLQFSLILYATLVWLKIWKTITNQHTRVKYKDIDKKNKETYNWWSSLSNFAATV